MAAWAAAVPSAAAARSARVGAIAATVGIAQPLTGQQRDPDRMQPIGEPHPAQVGRPELEAKHGNSLPAFAQDRKG